MAIRKIARMGHPILRKKARELTLKEIQSPDFERLLEDMVETMEEYGGIGLAAPQIYEPISVAIIDYQEDESRYTGSGVQQNHDTDPQAEHSVELSVFINPKITVLDEALQGFWEGCLSVPELRGLVYRPRKIQVDYINLKGKPQKIVAEGFLATVFQHELDHLNSTLFVDRIKNEPGKTTLAFTEEYSKYLTPQAEDDIGELGD
jgi:peptide deformylase